MYIRNTSAARTTKTLSVLKRLVEGDRGEGVSGRKKRLKSGKYGTGHGMRLHLREGEKREKHRNIA